MKRQSVGLPVSWAVLSKNVGQLQSWRGHAGLLFGFWLATGAQCVQRTGSAGDDVCRYPDITGSGVSAAVAKQGLNGARVGAAFQQVGGEAVAQGVGSDALGNATVLGGQSAGPGQSAATEVATGTPGGEQVVFGAGGAVIRSQHGQQARREHRVTILAALALPYVDD